MWDAQGLVCSNQGGERVAEPIISTPESVATDPAVAQASPTGWRIWLVNLLTYGKGRLAALGLALVVGLGAALLSLFLFAFLADVVMGQHTVNLDNGVLMTLRQVHSPALDQAAWVASALGAEWLAVLMVVLLVVMGWQRRWGAVVGLLITVIGAQLLNDVLKDWFQRTRPAPVDSFIPGQAFSFPSGHAMVAAAFYLYIGYLAWRLLPGRWRYICATLLVLVAFTIGLSRLYLGVHYLTDVVAGYIAGIAWTDSVIIAGHVLGRRRRGRAALTTESVPTANPIELTMGALNPADGATGPIGPATGPRDPAEPARAGGEQALAAPARPRTG